ncbi:hypothetical protein SAMN05216226_105104 [Halovenus aranensis]|uniref:Uncharacterized protein n=1 Tax=Halovenus aranensis TaxID=890420 RepID=A0A1G8UTA4_9EURY|nr:hypothetical protein [Halovenus aranensis]SDJ56949.1 hypothetical protein SAMN05216226_105104 [Halovenus aranensis]
MSLVKGTVHGLASMVLVVLGAVLTDTIRQNIELFERLSELTVQLLVDVMNLPISEEVPASLFRSDY